MANYSHGGGPPPNAEYWPPNPRWTQWEHSYVPQMDPAYTSRRWFMPGTRFWTPPHEFEFNGKMWYALEGVNTNFWYWEIWDFRARHQMTNVLGGEVQYTTYDTGHPSYQFIADDSEYAYRYNSMRWWGDEGWWAFPYPEYGDDPSDPQNYPTYRAFGWEGGLNYFVGEIGILVHFGDERNIGPVRPNLDNEWGGGSDTPEELEQAWIPNTPAMLAYGGWTEDNRMGGSRDRGRAWDFTRDLGGVKYEYAWDPDPYTNVQDGGPTYFQNWIGYRPNFDENTMFVTSEHPVGKSYYSINFEMHVNHDWFADQDIKTLNDDWADESERLLFQDKRIWPILYFSPPGGGGTPEPTPGSIAAGAARRGTVPKTRLVSGGR